MTKNVHGMTACRKRSKLRLELQCDITWVGTIQRNMFWHWWFRDFSMGGPNLHEKSTIFLFVVEKVFFEIVLSTRIGVFMQLLTLICIFSRGHCKMPAKNPWKLLCRDTLFGEDFVGCMGKSSGGRRQMPLETQSCVCHPPLSG